MREAGYATAAIVANSWVTRKRGYAQGFDVFDRADGLNSLSLTRIARRKLEELSSQDRPFFLYLHYMDPHLPNDPPAQLLDLVHPAGVARRPPETALAKMVEGIARYDGDIRLLDEGVAALFEHLRQMGLYEDAVIAFVSDHGEQFYEHGKYGHGIGLHDEEIHVPLIVKGPGLSGVVDDVVSTLDLAPALLELAGAPPLPRIQGLSLLTQRAERARRGAFSEGTMSLNHKAIVDARAHKLVIGLSGRSDEPVEPGDGMTAVGLYDLDGRGEKDRDRLDDPETQAVLEQLLLEQYARSLELRRQIEPLRVMLDPAERAQLEALGYGTRAVDTGSESP
jgi:arylsulfatase A-like enzyme